jgi:hypothetical protein
MKFRAIDFVDCEGNTRITIDGCDLESGGRGKVVQMLTDSRWQIEAGIKGR